MSRERIAQVLKALRAKSGLTADQVGAMIGKSGKTVNAWENNHGQPDAEMLMILCEIYQVENILQAFRENPSESFVKTSRSDEYASMFSQLDDHDQGIIIGEMKQMLRADKYQRKAKEA